MDRLDPKKVFMPLNCLTCHQPHSSSKPNLLVNDQEDDFQFCYGCHKNLKGPGGHSMKESAAPAGGGASEAPPAPLPPAAPKK
jgi:predicted CXXCH cytochrome family protein